MQHNITLVEAAYNAVDTYLATKHNTTYAAGDTLNVTLLGQREQKQFYIVWVLSEAEKVNKYYCILLLEEKKDASGPKAC